MKQKKAIEAIGLSKEFRTIVRGNSRIFDFFFPQQKTIMAVENVDLEVFESEIFGLLGPNGAGKTTLIKMLTGMLYPTEGKALIEGQSVEHKKQEIGVMLGYDMIYYRMTGYDNLKYFGRLYGVEEVEKRIEKVQKEVGIGNWLYDFVETYSLGMKSKLALARALIHDPKILFLDEPTLGLDPVVSLNIRDYIKGMKKTIIITTHNVEEALFLCQRIAIMHQGKIAKIDLAKNFKDIREEFEKAEESSK